MTLRSGAAAQTNLDSFGSLVSVSLVTKTYFKNLFVCDFFDSASFIIVETHFVTSIAKFQIERNNMTLKLQSFCFSAQVVLTAHQK